VRAMELSSSDSSDHDPSPSIPTLQDTTKGILIRTPSSPDGHDLRSPTEGSPLLKVKFKRSGSFLSDPAEEVETGGSDGLSLRRCNWKNLITTIYLWLTYLIVSAAYSIIGPFFPSEVRHGKLTSKLKLIHHPESMSCIMLHMIRATRCTSPAPPNYATLNFFVTKLSLIIFM
jgi:hypothetical protein